MEVNFQSRKGGERVKSLLGCTEGGVCLSKDEDAININEMGSGLGPINHILVNPLLINSFEEEPTKNIHD